VDTTGESSWVAAEKGFSKGRVPARSGTYSAGPSRGGDGSATSRWSYRVRAVYREVGGQPFDWPRDSWEGDLVFGLGRAASDETVWTVELRRCLAAVSLQRGAMR
jgi:hypothetical protein